MSKPEIERAIAADYGINSDYVHDLFHLYEQNPNALDDEWQSYFNELTGKVGAPAAPVAVSQVAPVAVQAEAPAPAAVIPPSSSVSTAPARAEAPVAASTAPVRAAATEPAGSDRTQLRGAALKIVENMRDSLAVPIATSQRQIPIKLLDENRRLINEYLIEHGRKVSFTHIIAYAIVKALEKQPSLNHGFEEIDGAAYRIQRKAINIGVAVDVTKKDGSRTLLVPNVKNAEKMSFSEFLSAYDDVVKRARDGKLQIPDFQGTTISLTNPGTLGTTASNPRLMVGQGVIVATGAIEYPPEYQAMSPEAISRIGISKVMYITSTYDHRIIQGAESGAFLAVIDEMLRGKHGFYDNIFQSLNIPYRPYRWATDRNPAILGEERYRDEMRKQVQVFELINAYRVRGHLIADIDPLGLQRFANHPELDIAGYGLTIWDLDREFITSGLGDKESATLRQIIEMLHKFYCGKVGIEYRHIQSPEEKTWLRRHIEREKPAIPAEIKKQILWKLISAEQFERFLNVKYLGQKRFSIEGNESVVAMLDQIIEGSPERGINDITIGMAHRGRLNVIANVIGHFCERIFTSFEGAVHPDHPHDQGDVKYHQGASGVRETAKGGQVQVTVMPNPSHLEFINPVVQGVVRAKQDMMMKGGLLTPSDRYGKLAVLLHGDSAFAGEGIVAETLNLSQLPGYSTCGTIHVIVNNQVGFTTTAEESRSSTYSTDVAKMVQAPIFHVNGDDPETVFHVLQIALDYRQKFHKDVVIDVMGFRRHGHNEGDEPTYTQPIMYKVIRSHRGVRALYAERLVREKVYAAEEAEGLIGERTRRYENAQLGAKEVVSRMVTKPSLPVQAEEPEPLIDLNSGVEQSVLRRIAHASTTVPKGFNINPKVVGLLGRRAKMAEGDVPVDWAMAEALAFGSLLTEGVSVRLTGQDCVRGTFSQRHMEFIDTTTGEIWTPFATLSDQAQFHIYDSPLSETGVLGFEYGYSVAWPQSLVLWEAQFGDFVNVAQVVIDQFIAPGQEKWNQSSRIVLLLPHGYEGQGPEHSSARIERFLQLCAKGNMQVVNCTTPAQYFHLLRRQAHRSDPKPLIVFTPKSLLRLPEASSPVEQFVTGGFLPILGDTEVSPSEVTRVLMCSGKIYFDLAAKRKALSDSRTAIIRLEQMYPFSKTALTEILHRTYPNVSDVCWVQEEPRNMGAWSFLEPKLRHVLKPGQTLRYAGLSVSPSTATGSHTIHLMQQAQFINEAFAVQ